VILGAASDDPASVGTYAAAGASLGVASLWTMPFTLPALIAVQFISAKVGMVSGTGLARVLRRHYPGGVLVPAILALAIANAFQAGADISAVAFAVGLVAPAPALSVTITLMLLMLALQVIGSYRLVIATCKWISLALLAYIGSAFFMRPNWLEVLRGTFLPTVRFNIPFLTLLLAVMGTTISPYMWFWQASQEAELRDARNESGRSRNRESESGTQDMALDIGTGMTLSNLGGYFIILGTAATLFHTGNSNATSAVGLVTALRPLTGNAAPVLFALGMTGTGVLGVTILGQATAYMLAETFGWTRGVGHRPHEAYGFYAILAAATLISILINLTGIDPLAALVWSGVIMGFLAPPFLALLMLVSNDRRIMGDRANGPALNVIGWTTTVLLCGIALSLVFAWLPI
jgi:Mn2+/Fe2+ NRAMP family transporter